jgi:hypothetical protein
MALLWLGYGFPDASPCFSAPRFISVLVSLVAFLLPVHLGSVGEIISFQCGV